MNRFSKLAWTVLITMIPFYAATATGKTLVVFDIDDTIKMSHVLSPVKAVGNAGATSDEIAFPQMAELAQSLKNDIGDIEFHYVSNAPIIMKVSHDLFLNRNRFPLTALHTNDHMLSGNQHKINTITQLVESIQPTRILMIGDNGERDVEVYEVIRNRYSNQIPMFTHIRMLYSEEDGGKKLRSFQEGFVGTKQLAMDLAREGFLTAVSGERLLKDNSSETEFISLISRLGVLSFSDKIGLPTKMLSKLKLGLPTWADCSMFDVRWIGSYSAEYIQLKTRIKEACAR